MRNGASPKSRPNHRSDAGQTVVPVEKTRLQIGELARQTEVSVETVRFYEARGLISPSTRRASGYREFGPEVVKQVRFIGRAQALGFSLTEIKELASLREHSWAGDATAQLRSAVTSKLSGIDARLQELRSLRNELASMVAACDAACPVDDERPSASMDVLECPLVDALERDASQSASPLIGKTEVVGPSKPGQRTGRQRRVPDRQTTSRRKSR
jgi:MerR family copper efflux transcriptional regulator